MAAMDIKSFVALARTIGANTVEGTIKAMQDVVDSFGTATKVEPSKSKAVETVNWANPTNWANISLNSNIFDGPHIPYSEVPEIKWVGGESTAKCQRATPKPKPKPKPKRDLFAMAQSPIEKKLLKAILARVPSHEVHPQYSIVANGKQYYLDFAVIRGAVKLCVEADGHDYHERTKQQAAHDRARDRALQLDRWMVLRFTGSEIHKDAASCANQVIQALLMGAL